jgi:hypothetical protein
MPKHRLGGAFCFWTARKGCQKSGRPGTGLYEEATQSVPGPADPTDPGDAADLSTPQGFRKFRACRVRNSGRRNPPAASRTGQTTCPNHGRTLQSSASIANRQGANQHQKSSFSKMLGLIKQWRNTACPRPPRTPPGCARRVWRGRAPRRPFSGSHWASRHFRQAS